MESVLGHGKAVKRRPKLSKHTIYTNQGGLYGCLGEVRGSEGGTHCHSAACAAKVAKFQNLKVGRAANTASRLCLLAADLHWIKGIFVPLVEIRVEVSANQPRCPGVGKNSRRQWSD